MFYTVWMFANIKGSNTFCDRDKRERREDSTYYYWSLKHTLNPPHLFLISGLVDFLLQNVHLLEGLHAVDAVDEYEAVGH